jgi:hypothetical protein
LFTVFTFVTLGVASGLLIAALVFCIKFELKSISDQLFITIVISSCVSVLLLLYGVWGSIWGGKFPKTLLAFFYLIYALGLGALGIVILALRATIIDKARDAYEAGGDFQEVLKNITGCETWNESLNNSCGKLVEEFYSTFGTGVGIGLILLFLILVIGDIFAWKLVCRKKESPINPLLGIRRSTPFRYSW